MPSLRIYQLFISHAWKYGNDYNRIVTMLNATPNFYYKNYSGPKDNPLIEPGTCVSQEKLSAAIRAKVAPASVVIVLAGMYVAHSDWIDYEISLSKSMNKPIIGVKPWGQERVPVALQNNAAVIVGWNTSTIVDAIRRYSL